MTKEFEGVVFYIQFDKKKIKNVNNWFFIIYTPNSTKIKSFITNKKNR